MFAVHVNPCADGVKTLGEDIDILDAVIRSVAANVSDMPKNCKHLDDNGVWPRGVIRGEFNAVSVGMRTRATTCDSGAFAHRLRPLSGSCLAAALGAPDRELEQSSTL